MAKTKEELNNLKQEIKSLCVKLSELSEEELSEVTGGQGLIPIPYFAELLKFVEGKTDFLSKKDSK